MENRIVIIDGNSLLNRAYYAMQKPMLTKEGLYTQGVYGFLNMLAKIKKDYPSGYMAVTFDRSAPTFRHLEYSEYKAGRKKMPPELAMQLPLLKEVLSAMRIRMLEMDGFEADDLIGTIARRGEEKGLAPLIITGDKDELQLATDVTRVVITRKGITEFEIYDHDAMVEKYGFTPAQFIDYKGLMGDQSDNIPGIPGVGEKTAQKLLLEFGSVENLLENAHSIPNEKLRGKIQENTHLAMMSKRLATINVNVPVTFEFEEYRIQKPDYQKLIDIYVKLEFNSFLKKLKTEEMETILPQESHAKEMEQELFAPEKRALCDAEDLRKFATELSGGELFLKVFSDHNHRSCPEIYGISMLTGNVCYFLNGEEKALMSELFSVLRKARPRICGHNLIQDYYALLALGLTAEKGAETIFETAFDTAIAQYVLEPSKSNYQLHTLTLEYFHEGIQEESAFLSNQGQMDMFGDPAAAYQDYGVIWHGAVLSLRRLLSEKLRAEELESVYYDVELPLIEAMASMENIGFGVDKDVLESIGASLGMQIEEASQEIYTLAGEQFNINSPQQLGQILFEKLELPTGKKLKTGYSTNAEVLEKLTEKHPIAAKILHYRMLTKLKGTYIDGLIPLIHKDGKIHAHFQQTVAATGRLSCTEPNLQNIPIRQEEGRQVRKAFVSSDDSYCLIGADYSQIELRVLAHMSADPELIDAFNRGADIHRLTAAKVLGIPEEEVTQAQRSGAKAVNFGVIYGMSGFGLSTELNITRKEAEGYIDEYFKKYGAVKAFMDEQVAEGKRQGCVKTILGRKRAIPEITASNFMVRQLGERLAMNSPIQGSAADIIKIAMIKVSRELQKEGVRSRLILQVHDELIVETAKEEADQIEELLRRNMEEAMSLRVRLDVGLSRGENWYELK